MRPSGLILLIALTLSLPAQNLFAQPTGHWRIFKKTDGLAENACVSVTLGASGNLLVRHAKSPVISVLDGYDITAIPGPGTNRHRAYESPGGQLWTASAEGLQEYRDGEWVSHRLPEIEKLFQAGFTNSVGLWPVRQGRVLVLLPDGLLQFTSEDADHSQSEMLRRADQSQIGAFQAMNLARDGGLWIAGERGLAQLAGPLRNLKSDSLWKEFIPPAKLGLRNFRSPYENESGAITMLADSAAAGISLVRFETQQWSNQPLKLDKLRFAWRIRNHTWAVTEDSLFHFPDNAAEPIFSEEISVRRIHDVVVEPNGIFWLATSDGLFRYAPQLWELPPPGTKLPTAPTTGIMNGRGVPLDLPKILGAPVLPQDEHIQSARWNTYLLAKNGDLWLGGAREIAWHHLNVWRIFSATNQVEPEDALMFAEAPDGNVWCATPGKIWEFDGKNWLPLRGGLERIRGLHCARDGTLWVASENGLHRFAQGAWLTYGAEDGLPSPLVRGVWADDAGQIWADTARGWSVFHPEADPDAPKTNLRDSVNGTQRFRDGAPVSLTFAGRDKWKFTAASRLLFSYRLDEREWSAFQEFKDVFFPELPLGRHFFQVRAMDHNGNIDPKAARLEFAVVVPWYRETRLLWILSFALVIALFFAALALNRQRQLRRAYAEVEKKIAERTRELELANRELLHSQKMNALGTLAAGIAHDFNNILSIIKGSAQIIEDNVENPEKIRTRTDRIKTVVEQGSGIVKAMLGFSSGTEGLAAPCNLNTVVKDTIKLLGDRFLREVQVSFQPAENLAEIPAAKDFIQQILLNFIFNAAEAVTTRKQIILSTRAVDRLPQGLVLAPKRSAAYVAVAVRDFGSGIAPENLARIFEPFFTTKALSTKRGTGLGLSMVYELAKKLEAGLTVESTLNAGSTFTLILPAPAEAAAASREPEKRAPALTPP